MPWCSFPWHKLLPRLAQKNCCLNLIDEFTSLFSPKVTFAGSLRKAFPWKQAFVDISVFPWLGKQRPRFAQGQPKGYFQMKELHRTTKAIAQMNADWKVENAHDAEFNVPTCAEVATKIWALLGSQGANSDPVSSKWFDTGWYHVSHPGFLNWFDTGSYVNVNICPFHNHAKRTCSLNLGPSFLCHMPSVTTKKRFFGLGPPSLPEWAVQLLCEMAPYIEICYACWRGAGGGVPKKNMYQSVNHTQCASQCASCASYFYHLLFMRELAVQWVITVLMWSTPSRRTAPVLFSVLKWMLIERWTRPSMLSSMCQHVARLQFDSCAKKQSLCGTVMMAWIWHVWINAIVFVPAAKAPPKARAKELSYNCLNLANSGQHPCFGPNWFIQFCHIYGDEYGVPGKALPRKQANVDTGHQIRPRVISPRANERTS